MEEEMMSGRSLAETPTWSVATVITALVGISFLVHHSLGRFRTWLVNTKRKALLAALEKIKEELMLFGVLSLLLGHWTIWVSKICIKSSGLSTRFYPCSRENYEKDVTQVKMGAFAPVHSSNFSAFTGREVHRHDYCPEGHEPFASYESLEQLHRLLIVLGIIHVSYSFTTVALAMLKISSWMAWESQARMSAIEGLQGSSGSGTRNVIVKRQSTFIFHHTSHPWSEHKIFIWLLCFIRQFGSSINEVDYRALRQGFITYHNLHSTYNFHDYMLRSMDEEFRAIVGISVPLWGYTIFCIFVNIHGINADFWLSFIPAFLILLVGTKLHHIVVLLALEVKETNSNFCTLGKQLNPRDGLFWFGKPKLLLWLIQIISFQNAFGMATFIWSLWEIREPSCFMRNHVFLVVRLTSGVIFQFWCSYFTFPLYVIVTQMGSKFKKALIAENIRESLHGWHERVKLKTKLDRPYASLTTSTSNASLSSMAEDTNEMNDDSRQDTSTRTFGDSEGQSSLENTVFGSPCPEPTNPELDSHGADDEKLDGVFMERGE
ncbi:MLO-like protein 4 [Aristolochia californica]|uniref:MLO-like protein 4 n=1 Tax=Aristolochia californica TaxID=171875 RepID=UPI0035E01913